LRLGPITALGAKASVFYAPVGLMLLRLFGGKKKGYYRRHRCLTKVNGKQERMVVHLEIGGRFFTSET
jgi:hypothetical protein